MSLPLDREDKGNVDVFINGPLPTTMTRQMPNGQEARLELCTILDIIVGNYIKVFCNLKWMLNTLRFTNKYLTDSMKLFLFYKQRCDYLYNELALSLKYLCTNLFKRLLPTSKFLECNFF